MFWKCGGGGKSVSSQGISENLKIHTGEKSNKCNGGEKGEDVGEMRPLKGEGVSEVPPLPY